MTASTLGSRKLLSVEGCHKKADECREYGKFAKNSEHRIMLEHMADTWMRIAADMQRRRPGSDANLDSN